MKNLMRIAFSFATVLFITALIIKPISAQTTQKSDVVGKPIPENVMKIFDKSCIKCHTEPGGNGMAASRVNLSKWDTYSPEKQAEKANKISNQVSKGKMPPKSFKKDHPGDVPSADEIKTISDWAISLQVPKK